MDTFRKVLVACAAVSIFSSGAYLVLSGADTVFQSRVDAFLAKTFKRNDELARVNNEGQ